MRHLHALRAVTLAVLAVGLSACGSGRRDSIAPDAGRAASRDGGPGGLGTPSPQLGGQDAGAKGPTSCAPGSPDQAGCTCAPGQTLACYDGPAATRGVAVCHDGTQTCAGQGEFGQYGACVGETLPGPEAGHCTDGVDDDCNGLTDCLDPACTADPACVTGNPPPPFDAGFDDAGFDSGPVVSVGACVAAQQTSGNERCPDGTVMSASGMCCPCQATDCGTNNTCCSAPVCASDPSCTTCSGSTLPAICGGFVDSDCDDFPEDCDQLCCPCKPASCGTCPDGQVPCDDGTGSGNTVCTDVTSNPNQCGACDIACSGTSCVNGTCM